MKTSCILFCCSTSLLFAAEAPFVNLDFESANLPYVTNASYIVSASDAFPGWTGWENDTIRTEVGYNGIPRGGQVAIFATGLYPFFTLGGLFMAHFAPWVDADCSLSQVGTIPADAQWLQFDTLGEPDSIDPLTLSFNGQNLALVMIASDRNFGKTFQADVSSFAGTTGELRINARPVFYEQRWWLANVDVDDIQFVPVPEPHVWALFGVGAVVFALFPMNRTNARSR